MREIVSDKRKCFYRQKKEGEKVMNLTMDMLEDYNTKNDSKKHFVSTFLTLFLKSIILKFEIRKLNLSKYIVVDKKIMSGIPTIKGTRITVNSIYESYSLHFDKYCDKKSIIKAIKKDYPSLSEEQILFALCYYIKKTSIFKLSSHENLNR